MLISASLARRLRRLYLRLPVPSGIKPAISRARWHLEEWGLLGRLGGPRVSYPPDYAPEYAPAAPIALCDPPRPGVRDLVVFGIIDWHFRFQRPQHMALELAKLGHRVFYLSVNLRPNSGPGFAHEQIDVPEGCGPIVQVFLNVPSALTIYTDEASPAQHLFMLRGLRHMTEAFGIGPCFHLVQHPFWQPLASASPLALVVYDCMDHHAGFHLDEFVHRDVEQELIDQAELCIASASAIEQALFPRARRLALIRNAGDPAHFSKGAKPSPPAPGAPQRIGYYGAVADWFDLEALRAMALAFPEHEFHVVGDDTLGAQKRLGPVSNVAFFGEQPYGLLPDFLASWDICLIPFLRNPLTNATNPVKIYEYLSAGKPVVATRLPELVAIANGLDHGIWLAESRDEFVMCLGAALAEVASPMRTERMAARQAFALRQTWANRAHALQAHLLDRSEEPVGAVVVVSFNQWALTLRCLKSLTEESDEPCLEIIVVDNHSSDESPRELAHWEARQQALGRPHRVVQSSQNLGYGGALNRGFAMAQGQYLVALNNDLVVTPGWARGLRRHLERHPRLGVICPTTNNIGNEAQVWVPGESLEEVLAAARRRTLDLAGQYFLLHVAAFFCVMLRRETFELVGPLDEQFFPGYYEDDDYCYRIRAAGLEVACAEDVFVYHELSASFNAEGAAKRQALLDQNRLKFEQKWGPWRPHQYRRESLPPRRRA